MIKVHITLVGGQPTPVYHAIKATVPDFVVFIYSEDTTKQLNLIKNEVPVRSRDVLLHPTDAEKIRTTAEELAKEFATDEVTVNISGGLKSWSFWFGVIFHKCTNASVIYIDQNNTLWNYNTMQCREVPDIDLLVQFRLHGNPIDGNYTPYTEYTDADKEAIKDIKYLRSQNYEVFNRLATVLTDKQNNRLRNDKNGIFTIPNDPRSFIQWEGAKEKGQDQKITISICRKNGQCVESEICSPHAKDLVFKAGWFEYEIATLVAKWDKAKEIFLNCHFPFIKGVDKNEVDIIVNTGKKALFIECKTQINSSNDIDKFTSVIKKYGGIGSKGLFVTDAPMRDLDKKKCEENHILHFSLQEHTNNPLLPAGKALAMLLKENINKINAR